MDNEINNRKSEVLLNGRLEESCLLKKFFLINLKKQNKTHFPFFLLFSLLQVSRGQVEGNPGWRCGSSQEK